MALHSEDSDRDVAMVDTERLEINNDTGMAMNISMTQQIEDERDISCSTFPEKSVVAINYGRIYAGPCHDTDHPWLINEVAHEQSSHTELRNTSLYTSMVRKLPGCGRQVQQARHQTAAIAAELNIDVTTIQGSLKPHEPHVNIAQILHDDIFNPWIPDSWEVADIVASLIQHCDRELFLRQYLEMGLEIGEVELQREFLVWFLNFVNDVCEAMDDIYTRPGPSTSEFPGYIFDSPMITE
ncbi:hypothetical protein BGW36DRAFT_423002 [Talaromyces proteolyticus]|uniref:Uncharacterized protein n=1 Tax=Talaromyces proteolyticus TaxID=1131652 RepID=A0AAD4L3B5_9EURO|nr:uncharacterized protein BGW36DRAFT_423002 [Talaromyces proteolyticus]KAH8703438.1 hypothetical protein BGW36DRAFT_423002 [Talaromyces proteolyticus]